MRSWNPHACQNCRKILKKSGVKGLRHLATECNSGVFIERSLQDHFISGIYIFSSTRKKLLNEDCIIQDALKVALVDEAARKEIMLFQEQKGPTVNVVRNQYPPSRSPSEPQRHGYNKTVQKPFQRKYQPMLREYPYKSYPSSIPSSYVFHSCGEMDHNQSKCIYKDKVCHKCNIILTPHFKVNREFMFWILEMRNRTFTHYFIPA